MSLMVKNERLTKQIRKLRLDMLADILTPIQVN